MRIDNGFRNILLINLPVLEGKYRVPDFPPIGLGYLSQNFLKEGIRHDVLDMALGYSVHALFSKIERGNHDLIGFSLFTYQHLLAYKIIAKVKHRFPDVCIVVGGPHVSTMREQVLKDCPAIDFGVFLEGEVPLIKLCRGDHFQNIHGLIFRQDGDIRSNEAVFVEDLDQIPYPRFEKFELEKYSENIAIFTSRGCPYDCIYCPVTRTIGKKYRARSPGVISEEIKYWYDRGYRRILILDDNFTLIKERVQELCRWLKSASLDGLMFSCANGIRADRVDDELLKDMRMAGFNEIAFGVEAGNNKVLKAIKKRETIEVIEARIKRACELDYKVVLFFLIGSPTETYDDFLQSVALALRYPIYSARFYNLIPFPHSELFEWVKLNNYFLIPPEKYLTRASHHINQPLFATPEFSERERKKAFGYAQRIEKLIKRRYVLRKAKGPILIRHIYAWLYTNAVINYLYRNISFIRRTGFKIRRTI